MESIGGFFRSSSGPSGVDPDGDVGNLTPPETNSKRH